MFLSVDLEIHTTVDSRRGELRLQHTWKKALKGLLRVIKGNETRNYIFVSKNL
jgi:hypothetical protein